MTGTAPTHQAKALSNDAAEHSRFVQRIRRRYADELAWFPKGVPQPADWDSVTQRLQQQGLSPENALRVLRHLVLERLACLDCNRSLGLEAVTQVMTELAQWALDRALQASWGALTEIHGAPWVEETQTAAQIWVVGMGKLGARELNVSSDIDLIYIYDHEGQTQGNAQGAKRISNHEFFSKLVKRMQAYIGEATEHGQVFRVDLALRPNGNSGPSACSLAALEEYFVVQGREWERFAWLKSRVVAPERARSDASAMALRDVVLPFVFRRYLDYRVFEGLRRLHRQIRQHASQQAAARPERANDVKLGRGGIREIEFIVQLLQVVRGGQFPELRTRGTLRALERLQQAGLVLPEMAEKLSDAYRFLREVEHRIQYLDDQQTQVMPTDSADVDWLSHTMGCANRHDFETRLESHRQAVAQEFERLLGQDESEASDTSLADDLSATCAELPADWRPRALEWVNGAKVSALDDAAKDRLGKLLLRTGAWLEEGRIGLVAAERMMDWLEPLLRRQSYLALLQERPSTHQRLLRLLGAARWPAKYLIQHPGVIDELASAEMLDERFDAAQLRAELTQRRQALQRSGEDDEERLLDLLRRAHHAEVFRTLARDVEGRITVEAVADDLSALAQVLLQVAVEWSWQHFKGAHRDQPQIGIIAYGKWGGQELGYGSDLDIVFVFDDDAPQAAEIYAAWVRKLISWLTVKTAEGDLFEIDTALRPNGNAGLLVSPFEAFSDYQLQRGSNTAWTWEHQAITRARLVVGEARLQTRFEAVRAGVMTAPREAQALRDEIVAMRAKVAAAHKVPAGRFDVKHSPGGMVDIEFAVQTLLLLHSQSHPELLRNAGNIGLLQEAQRSGLLPSPVGEQAANAYRALRLAQHKARLDEAATHMDPADWQGHINAVRALWQCALETALDR